MVGGWAADLDAAAGTGIDTLHVWAYPLAGGPPVFQGTTQYGDTGLTSRRYTVISSATPDSA